MKLTANIDKLGTLGLIITALLSPCCFPLFALAASALGLGSFELFGGYTMWIFQAMAIISVIGFYFSYRTHRCLYPLLIAIPSAISIFYGYHFNNSDYWIYFLYAGMFGLTIATGVNYYRNRLHGSCITVNLQSTISCPKCEHSVTETMPENACVYFYECSNCKEILKPKEGDCCVYCSYGSVKCPPIQAGNNCC